MGFESRKSGVLPNLQGVRTALQLHRVCGAGGGGAVGKRSAVNLGLGSD